MTNDMTSTLCIAALAVAAGCGVFDDTLPLETESGEATSTATDGGGSTGSSTGNPSTSTSIDPDGGSTSTTSSSTGAADASTDDTGTTGGLPSCNDGPTPADALAFGPPVPLPGVNTRSWEEFAWLSPDELEVWIGAVRPEGAGSWDVYHATRDDPAAAFGPAMLLTGVSTVASEEGVSLTADRLTLYSASDGAASMGGVDIMTTTRPSTLVEFGALAPVANVNSTTQDVNPHVTADGSELYFATDREGTWDVYRAQLGAGGTFGAPSAVGELSTSDNELAPVLSADGLTIYFTSNRDDPQFDIHVATRSTRDDGFGPAVNLSELNVDGVSDLPVWVSSDGCRLVFSSLRPDGSNGYDLWIAEREP